MNELRDFFKLNEINVGNDIHSGTPIYYDSLRSGFFHYFSTYLDHKETLHLLLDADDWTIDKFSDSRLQYNISHSILGFHRFFESFLKNVLRKINPFLAVKFLEKEEELFEFFNEKLLAENVKSIEFGEALKRLKQAFKYFSNESEIYKLYLKEIEFINQPNFINGLHILAEWRNRIMHNGTTFPNNFSFEYLITQNILPLIFQIVDLDKKKTNFEPHYFVTLTGIEIIKTLINIKFDYKNPKTEDEKEQRRIKFYEIAHLKELGRASYTQDFYRRKDKDYKEMQYDSPIRRAAGFALAEKKEHKECFAINNCNCCSAKSQVVYRKEDKHPITNKQVYTFWLRCFNCDYSIGSNIFDPFYFGLSEQRLFPTDIA